jgi:ribulose-phosphate 3-epimerase
MVKVSASMLSANFLNLEKDIRALEKAGADYLHMDIMDGLFVPNISYGPFIIKQIHQATDIPLDVHLMIQEPYRYVEDFVKAGASIITVHQEACVHLNRTVEFIKSFGISAGVSLNPANPIGVLEYVLDDIDMVLLMTVNPGFGGQHYIENSTAKIRDMKKMIAHRKILIEVDGGINQDTAPAAVEAGADILVSGSYLFKGDIKENIGILKALR